MIKDFHFKDIRTYLEKQNDTAILDAFDKLADAAIIFTPMLFGPQFLPLLELLEVKDKLVGLGKSVVGFIASKQEPDCVMRFEQMKVAYALICFTAYFEALDNELPKEVRKKLKLKFETKQELIRESAADMERPLLAPLQIDVHCELPYTDHVTSYSETIVRLEKLYEGLSKNILKLISESGILEKAPSQMKTTEKVLLELSSKAVELYKSQYLNLADTFSDFAFFAQCKEFEALQQANAIHRKSLSHISAMTNKIDVGLANLSNVVNSIATNYSAIQSQEIVDDLKNIYRGFIEQPIIDDKEIVSSREKIALAFPKIIDAFIPQSYKCLSYQQREIQLEDESIWNPLEIQNDLDRFFVKYLYSPDSIEYPLVILGHPGSGKSLLTKVLSAQLMSESYTVIRIPLREINADADIDYLVEEQIRKTTNRPLPQGYGGFAKQFSEKPLIIILDGYDELLQAKGDVFSGYLERVRAFQQTQKQLERPVRIIVTSRITLIDKAIVPINSTILRLMEFNASQRQMWIDIWNRENATYFSSSSPRIEPFSLPKLTKGKKSSLIELAEQPLLLLMLALYDSEDNSLAKLNNNIRRTELYDNLLRRFVRRERGRYVPGFTELSSDNQEVFIDKEMKRLGVVAIGMYNRRKLYIQSKELDYDLKFFDSGRDDSKSKNHTLKDSESLLGGFFFIHQSTAQDVGANNDNSDSAFEFLHNTFGEFLTADFILRFAVQEVNLIYKFREDSDFASALATKLSSPDGFCKEWFACLMFTPLYSRPVVIEMIQEHIQKSLERCGIRQDDFRENLKYIVQNQLKMVLGAKQFPSVMLQEINVSRDIPLLGYISIYTLNLIILASVLCPDGFEFNEEDYQAEIVASETKPWDKLSSLWKTWFSPKDLTGLSAILKASRVSETTIVIKCNDRFEAALHKQPVDILLCISSTLADNLLTGLAGLHSQRFVDISKLNEQEILTLLENESTDLFISYLILILRKQINMIETDYKKINNLINRIIHLKDLIYVNRDVMLSLYEVIESCLNRNIIFYKTRRELFRFLPNTIEAWVSRNKKLDSACASGVRLLQQLSANKELFATDKRMFADEPIYRYSSYEFEESDYIQHRYLPRFFKGDRFYMQDLEGNNAYQFYMLDTIENNPNINPKEKEHILDRIVSPQNIEVLLETNPELISKALLILAKDHQQKLSSGMFGFYFERCIKQIKTVGIRYFGYKAILNTVEIARYRNEYSFLDALSEILRLQLFGHHPDYFSAMLYQNPSFIAALIDHLPDIFANMPYAEFIERFFFEKRLRYISPERALDYIKVFRYFLNIESKNAVELKKIIDESLHRLTHTLSEYNWFPNWEFDKLTMEQLQNLLWFSKIINNKKLTFALHDATSRIFKA